MQRGTTLHMSILFPGFRRRSARLVFRMITGLAAGLVLTFGPHVSFGQSRTVTLPRPVSPAAEVSQTIGLTNVTVKYSRPRVTLNGVDRSGKIWGVQVPYGFSVLQGGNGGKNPWRAGANENTTITFTDDVKIEGTDLAAGSYGLHMAIYEDERATIIFSKNHTSWGSFFYEPSEDALRVDVKTGSVPHTEVLTYQFTDMGSDFAVLALMWEKKAIPIRIQVDVHEMVLQNFRNELRGLPAFFWEGFQTAAQYCVNNNINQAEALQWAETAVSRNRSFQTLSTKGGLLYLMGKRSEGDATLDTAASLANKAQLNALGYQLLGQQRYAKAIEFFKKNIADDPNDPNGFDSLGEAYKISGDKENAIKYLRKSLSLDPPPAVKANSEKLLKELGVM